MKIKLLLLGLFFLKNAMAIDLGNGADGTCDVSGGATTQINSSKKTYQCTSLIINGNLNDFKGGQPGGGGSALVIKVLGTVTINAGTVIDLSGQNGTDGSAGLGTIAGGAGGAGGGAGGDGSFANGANGSGLGAGAGGDLVSLSGGAASFGGGGGGGSYKSVSTTLASSGNDGVGAVPSTEGSNGSVYGNESNFENSFLGGSGGGAGGGASDNVPTQYKGSSGGGGGGAIMIVAGGNIQIDGEIKVHGGNGGGSLGIQSSGGGGGGSGGAIWIMSEGDITVGASGVLDARSGATESTGGKNNGLDGYGGNGGNGRIRLDDKDGAITNLGTVTPSAYVSTFVSTTNPITSEFKSSINCNRVLIDISILETCTAFVIGLITIYIGQLARKRIGQLMN